MLRWAGAILLLALAISAVIWLFPARAFPVHASGAVLVTGASSGIGKHLCLHIAANTSFTAFCGVRTEAAARELQRLNPEAMPLILDVTKPIEVRTLQWDTAR